MRRPYLGFRLTAIGLLAIVFLSFLPLPSQISSWWMWHAFAPIERWIARLAARFTVQEVFTVQWSLIVALGVALWMQLQACRPAGIWSHRLLSWGGWLLFVGAFMPVGLLTLQYNAEHYAIAPLPVVQHRTPSQLLDAAMFAIRQRNEALVQVRVLHMTRGGINMLVEQNESVVLKNLGWPSDVMYPRPERGLADDRGMQADGADGQANTVVPKVRIANSVDPLHYPVVLAHEWAHTAGVVDEAAAQYVAFRTCLHAKNPLLRAAAWEELAEAAARRASTDLVPMEPDVYDGFVDAALESPEMRGYGVVPAWRPRGLSPEQRIKRLEPVL